MTTAESTATGSGRPPVSSLTATTLVYSVVLRHLATRGRVVALSLLALVAPVAGALLGASDSADLDDAVSLVAALGFAVVIPVVSLVFGGAALGDLREDKTLVYLWLRPIGRFPIALGAALAAATLAAPITLIPVTVMAALTRAGNGIVGATLLAGVVAVVAYVALFTFAGAWLRRFIVWGLAYILIWEGFIALGGPGVARFAIRKYTRSILVDITGADLTLADFSAAVGVVVPLAVAALAVVGTARLLGRQDVD
jgi:ABC-2 type transport system permease protein